MGTDYSFKSKSLKGDKGEWEIRLDDDAMVLIPAGGGNEIRASRSAHPEAYNMTVLPFSAVKLTVKGHGKLLFRLSAEQAKAISAWQGPMGKEHLETALKQRFKWILPIAIILIFSSLPLPGDPSSGLSPIPLDVVTAGLGIMLFLLYVASKIWKTGILFLLDSIWFILVTADVVSDVVYGGNYLWLLLVPLLLLGAWAGFHEYKRFKSVG